MKKPFAPKMSPYELCNNNSFNRRVYSIWYGTESASNPGLKIQPLSDFAKRSVFDVWYGSEKGQLSGKIQQFHLNKRLGKHGIFKHGCDSVY